MNEQELFNSFNKLSLNDKRNEYNMELNKLYAILLNVYNLKGHKEVPSSMIDYDQINDSNMSESDYLNLEYENLMKLRKLLINYISWEED